MTKKSKKPDDNWWNDVLVVYAFIFTACIVAMLLCVSCSPKIIREVETKIEYRDRIVRDTAIVEIEREVEKVVTRDTVSRLENKLAKSEAVVSGGFLTHSLETKPQKIPVPVEVHVTDTVIVEKEAQIIEREVKVEKPLSWWQKFKIGAFWWLFLGVIVSLVIIFRKPIAKLLKLWIGL